MTLHINISAGRVSPTSAQAASVGSRLDERRVQPPPHFGPAFSEPPGTADPSKSTESGPALEEERLPPFQLGAWRVVRQLGQGQWTRVYQAQPLSMPPSSPADYAVKVLRPERKDDPIAAEMLQREADVGRDVSHPNLISVLCVDSQRPPQHLVTPYIWGATVEEGLAGHGAMPLPHALWIARQTAQGLSALHRRGWRHADVKPANLLVAPEGHVTLLDLGFAQQRKTKRTRHGDSTDKLWGSLAYMAPETLSSSLAGDAPSDIYSLGVVLFEMLTGRRPFLAEDPAELAEAHLQRSPPDLCCPQSDPPSDPSTDSTSLSSEPPFELAQLVRRMLAKEPLRRPLADELVLRLARLEIQTFHQR